VGMKRRTVVRWSHTLQYSASFKGRVKTRFTAHFRIDNNEREKRRTNEQRVNRSECFSLHSSETGRILYG
jgi:hypothetical protein